MKPIQGLNTDVSPLGQGDGSMRFARNIVLGKLDDALINEPGTVEKDDRTGYYILHSFGIKGNRIVRFMVAEDFAYNDDFDSRIDILNPNGDIDLILTSTDLKLDINASFKAVHYFNNNGDLIVAWTNGSNPPRILNFTSPEFDGTAPDAKYIVRMALFPDCTPPSIQSELSGTDNGSILNGGYTFFIAYEIDRYFTTNFFSASGAYLVGKGEDYDGTSSEAIKLNLLSLDTNYDYYRVYAIRNNNGTQTAHYLMRKEVPSDGADSVIWTGVELGTETVSNILVNTASYDTAQTLTVVNNQLYLGNVTTQDEIDFQPYANSIVTNWVYRPDVQEIIASDSTNTGELYGSWRGYMPGATYAFYITLHLKNGTHSRAFHIPGHYSGTSSVYDTLGDGTARRNCDINDYSSFTGTSTETDDFGNSYTVYKGGMSYTRNEDEYYPDNDDWDAKGTDGSTVGVLRNTNVRHHKFPSVQALKSFSSGLDTNNWNYTFGVSFDNIIIPEELQDLVQGYTIHYAARDFGDMDVVAMVPTLAWNFQDTANTTISDAPTCSSLSCSSYSVTNSGTSSGQFSYTDCNGDPGILSIGAGETIELSAYTGSITVLQGTSIASTLLGTDTATSCDYATISSWKMRIYDPTLLNKKPELSSVYVVPEWYNNTSYCAAVGASIDDRITDELYSNVGVVEYVPSNSVTFSNKEREEVARFNGGNIIAGEYQGRGAGLQYGVNGHFGNHIIMSTLRQRIPNIYANFAAQTLASTGYSKDLLYADTGSDSYLYEENGSIVASTPAIFGGDMSLETVKARYMSQEDSDQADIETDLENYLGYTYFIDNDVCKSVRDIEYTVPSRLPATKMYEDESLAPVLNSSAVSSYDGEYLNQYLMNAAYELINTAKPAICYDSLLSQSVSKFPNRIPRSDVQQSESASLDWRRFAALDYYDLDRTKGDITNLEEYNGELIIHTEFSLFKTISKNTLDTSEVSIALGSGDLFSVTPGEIIDTAHGVAGTQNMVAALKTKAGYFFVDRGQGRLYTLGATLDPISSKGRRRWFQDKIPFELESQLEALGLSDQYDLYDAPSSPFGQGFTAAYDFAFDRILVSKRSWHFADVTDIATDYDNITADDGLVYFRNGVPGEYLSEYSAEYADTGGFVPLDMDNDTRIVREDWTTSYYPNRGVWAALHDYLPSFMCSTREYLYSFSGSTTHLHNVGSPGDFYGETYPSYFDVIFNMGAPGVTKKTTGFTWIGHANNEYLNNYIDELVYAGNTVDEVSIRTSATRSKDITFTSATVYNSYQLSEKISLVPGTSLRNAEGVWRFNKFRDILSQINTDIVDSEGEINYDLLDTTKNWYERKRFVDQYVALRLEYDNADENIIVLYEVSAMMKESFR